MYGEPLDVPAAPHPDWSQAPEWATWWAVDADCHVWWWELEPMVSGSGWTPMQFLDSGRGHRGEVVDIPLGVDWRVLKQQRPQPATGGDDAPTQP